ncbi:unnamed protein product [Chironomus riparius]|uniref:Uncharacterized protein n=1 Tax=Chironomus riparius TaxID=315576 RepID=A0A9N9S717_9DIPT|nr:unnamed protein product [Chironomus riparius]
MSFKVSSSIHKVNITLLSISICEIIENFYSKYSKNVDIINIGGTQDELVGEIMKNINSSMAVTLISVPNILKWNTKLEHQSILLFDYFEYFDWFTNHDFVEMRYINSFRFVVYCPFATYYNISNLTSDNNIAPLYYIIVFDQDKNIFKLLTFENRNDLEACHERQRLMEINEFTTDTQKWLTKPIFPKKYTNFYNCIMHLGVQESNSFLPSKLTGTHVENEFAGLGYILFVLAQKLNFSVRIFYCDEYNCNEEKSMFIFYNVFAFPILSMFPLEMDSFGWRYVMINVPAM